MKKRYEELDILKGWAMVLVYLGHCFQFTGINITGRTFFNMYLHEIIYSFHMPLFFLISGFLSYTEKEIELKKFYINKIERLLIPYIFINLVDFVLRISFPKFVNSNFEGLERFLLEGTKISWFVYTLFIIFVIFPILDSCILKRDKYYIFGFVLLLINYLGVFHKIKLFSIDSVSYYLIYFYLGYIIKKDFINKKWSKKVLKNIFFLIITLLFFLFAYKYYWKNIFTQILFAGVGSLFSLNLVVRLKNREKITEYLKYIGVNSLAFYLLEGFLSVFYRTILIQIIPLKFNYTIIFTFFFLKVVTGYIVIKYIITRSGILSFLVGARKELK